MLPDPQPRQRFDSGAYLLLGDTKLIELLQGFPFLRECSSVPEIATDMSCAEAFNKLMDSGFELVHSGAIPWGGVVDASDYTLCV